MRPSDFYLATLGRRGHGCGLGFSEFRRRSCPSGGGAYRISTRHGRMYSSCEHIPPRAGHGSAPAIEREPRRVGMTRCQVTAAACARASFHPPEVRSDSRSADDGVPDRARGLRASAVIPLDRHPEIRWRENLRASRSQFMRRCRKDARRRRHLTNSIHAPLPEGHPATTRAPAMVAGARVRDRIA